MRFRSSVRMAACIVVLAAGCLALIWALPRHALAAGGACQWTPLFNISEDANLSSKQPAAVGDPYGHVHVFWTEQNLSDSANPDREFVAYRYWDGKSWSPIYDILVAPDNGWANVAEVVVDPDGRRLHLAWVDNLGTNVSSVDTLEAGDARAWRTERIAFGGNMGLPALTIDRQARLHMLYADDFRSLEYMVSDDGGLSWSEPLAVWSTTDQGLAIAYPNLLMDREDGLHATWQLNEERLDWTPSGIKYTGSVDGGQTWTSPVELSQVAGGNPTLAEDNNGTIHLLWNGRAGSGGRFYTWSDDHGNTWAPVKSLDGYLGGLSGRPKVVTDSLGRLHMLQGSGLANGGGINSAFLVGHEWSPPESIPEAPGTDYPALAITGGDQLHAFIWTQVKPAAILYSRCQTNAPALTPAPTPETLSPQATLTPAVSQVIRTRTSTPSAQATAAPSPLDIHAQARAPSDADAFTPLLAGGLSALALIGVVLITRGRRSR